MFSVREAVNEIILVYEGSVIQTKGDSRKRFGVCNESNAFPKLLLNSAEELSAQHMGLWTRTPTSSSRISVGVNVQG